MFAHGETVVKMSPGVRTDSLGDEVEDWRNPAEEAISGVAVYSSTGTEEAVGGRDSDLEFLTLLLPAGVDCDFRDRWNVHGVTWMQDSQPLPWCHPMTGWEPGVQVNLVRKRG